MKLRECVIWTVKKRNLISLEKTYSQCQSKLRNAMDEDYLTLFVDWSLYSFLLLLEKFRYTWHQFQNFVTGTNINSDRKVKIPFTWRKFPAIRKMKTDISVNKVNVLYPSPWLETTLPENQKERFNHKIVLFVNQRFIHDSEINDIEWHKKGQTLS